MRDWLLVNVSISPQRVDGLTQTLRKKGVASLAELRALSVDKLTEGLAVVTATKIINALERPDDSPPTSPAYTP